MRILFYLDFQLPPHSVAPSSFTETEFTLSWEPPLNHSCIKLYITDSPNMEVSSLTTSYYNITMTDITSNQSFTIGVAGMDYDTRVGNFSEYLCIKLTGMSREGFESVFICFSCSSGNSEWVRSYARRRGLCII